MASTHPTLPKFDGTIGAMEIGILLNVLLCGTLTIQSYTYYTRFSQDHPFLRWLVLTVRIIEIAHTGTLCHTLYTVTVSFFGNPTTLIHPPHSLLVTVTFGGISTAIVQGFLALRVWRLVNLLWLAIICWIFTAIRLMGCLTLTITGWHMTSLPEYKSKFDWILVTLLVVSMTNDLVVTGGLCFTLYRSRKKAQKKMTRVIDKLIGWTLESGLLTSICGMLVVITFFASPNTFAWIGIYVISPKFFSNSLLAILNGRSNLRQDIGSSVTASTLNVGNATSTSGMRTLDIKMTKVQTSVLDYEASEEGRLSPEPMVKKLMVLWKL
ncbi:hypothetical protein DL96DRAFT_1682033 [Flagelloscypha sp. PMI_526]|nr:hypothetical protein DL96DRAFT_1682033 [Flagelloscypha sp. PMI_526]